MHSYKTRCRVIYGDTDNMGIAYHANYFRWFEIGRTEMFRSLGLPYKALEEKGIYLPVSEAMCKYISSARYDDTIIVDTTMDKKLRAGIKFNYQVLLDQDEKILALGYTCHACVNNKGRVVRPPKFLVEIFEDVIS